MGGANVLPLYGGTFDVPFLLVFLLNYGVLFGPNIYVASFSIVLKYLSFMCFAFS